MRSTDAHAPLAPAGRRCNSTALSGAVWSGVVLIRSVLPLCASYASITQHDAKFGALVDAFKYQWIGSGLIKPPKPCAEDTIRWALQSTTATGPVLHVALVAMSPSMTALLRRHVEVKV